MNLTKYDVFFKVLETKTISQAAKELGYSQSAVSQTIKSLEEELEATLFIRQKKWCHSKQRWTCISSLFKISSGKSC